jgi:ABC-type glycerol-3-phosphate transport system permease component
MQETATVAQCSNPPKWGMALPSAAIMAIAPGLLIAIFLQKYLTGSLTMGAVK